MKFGEIAGAALPPDVHRAVTTAMHPRWKGARMYMPAVWRGNAGAAPRSAVERFAAELRAATVEAGGTPAQADEILTALSGGYFWV